VSFQFSSRKAFGLHLRVPFDNRRWKLEPAADGRAGGPFTGRFRSNLRTRRSICRSTPCSSGQGLTIQYCLSVASTSAAPMLASITEASIPQVLARKSPCSRKAVEVSTKCAHRFPDQPLDDHREWNAPASSIRSYLETPDRINRCSEPQWPVHWAGLSKTKP